jgi:Helix-turn-helix domain
MSDRHFVLVPYDPRETLPVKEAADLAGRSQSTIRNWCERFEIARRIAGGNWQVSRVALRMLLDGDMDALAAYSAGDRTSPSVAAYFERLGLGGPIPLPEERQ